MIQTIKNFITFITGCITAVLRGNKYYYIWMLYLLFSIVQGGLAYITQFNTGLIMTNMRDAVPWGFYIANFTFLVGVAAAAIMLVIPAYIYNWKPLKEVVLFGELLAIAAIIMCLLFVTVDLGRSDRFWHLIPFIGRLHFPTSLLAWDVIVINLYLGINIIIVFHILYSSFNKRDYNHHFITPLILFSIPLAISLHTVTAFLFNGMPSRPFWNSSILAPRFLASAFCSGPAILIILFQILRKTTSFRITDEAVQKIAELMAYAMFINLFLFGAEIFKEYYSGTEHLVYLEYLFGGLQGQPSPIAPFAWASFFMGIIAFILILNPGTRKNFYTMNIGCILIYGSVYFEKGMALIIPGFTPDAFGQIYEYFPSTTEFRVTVGVFGIGFLILTLLVKISVAIIFENLNADKTN